MSGDHRTVFGSRAGGAGSLALEEPLLYGGDGWDVSTDDRLCGLPLPRPLQLDVLWGDGDRVGDARPVGDELPTTAVAQEPLGSTDDRFRRDTCLTGVFTTAATFSNLNSSVHCPNTRQAPSSSVMGTPGGTRSPSRNVPCSENTTFTPHDRKTKGKLDDIPKKMTYQNTNLPQPHHHAKKRPPPKHVLAPTTDHITKAALLERQESFPSALVQ
jgi:hypothetical protein